MAWVRGGDTALTHPVVVRGMTVAGADSRTWRELLGTAHLLASVAGAHLTDGVIEAGHLMMVCGADMPTVAAQMVEAGYLTPDEIDGRQVWRLINDPELIHIRSRAEVEWDRARKRDASNADVTLRVVLRDGSACRYCGRTVSWKDRRGTRAATYDHRIPGKPAKIADDLFVACKGCNSSRKDDPTGAWDREHPRLPAPDKPYYCDHARARLAAAGITVDPASAPPETGSGPTGTNAPATAGRGHRDERPADLADLDEGPEASFPGTGRDGSGQAVSGAAARRRARRRRTRAPDRPRERGTSGPGGHRTDRGHQG
ncbi:HNH endonuclease [Jiangella gansuensis]|uniref:HNH endonuclease n=1 Tax=Jiangella gansuensis TaxID=281473 RepID=UPI0004B4188D|nr:HNH endonuclease [Jiangella gansuensis]